MHYVCLPVANLRRCLEVHILLAASVFATAIDMYTFLMYNQIMKTVYRVILSKKAKKALKHIPLHIVLKLNSWMSAVATYGLLEVRKIAGYHDEPLKGQRQGQRSIRLNRSYRAIYVIDDAKSLSFVEIIEVNKHEY